jgi:hypothetical integral membrane protein (TIGR02206 family)
MTRVSFWTFLKNYTEYGSGFATFGTEHLTFLACIAICLAAACVFYRRASGPARKIFFKTWVVITLSLEVFKQAVLISTGVYPYPKAELPLHLCGLFIFVNFFHAFKPTTRPGGSDVTGEMLYCLGLPAALAALLTPDWTRYPALYYFSIQGFVSHGFIVGAPLLLLAGNQLRPNFKNLWKVAICLAAAAIPIAILNSLIHTNFMFLTWPPKGTPLEIFDIWFGFLGSHGYILGLILLIIVIWLIMYLPWIVLDLRKKKQRLK